MVEMVEQVDQVVAEVVISLAVVQEGLELQIKVLLVVKVVQVDMEIIQVVVVALVALAQL